MINQKLDDIERKSKQINAICSDFKKFGMNPFWVRESVSEIGRYASEIEGDSDEIKKEVEG